MAYRNNIHNTPPPPCYYKLDLFSTTATRTNGTSYWWNINIPSVASTKQYFIRPTKVYIQDLNVANTNIRTCLITSESIRGQNSYSSGIDTNSGKGYSNIIGAVEINHGTNVHWIAYNEEPHMNFISGGFINGQALQNNEINIRICDLNNADLVFNASNYADLYIELTLFEIYNPQFMISTDYQHDRLKYEGTSTTQIQGTTR